MREPGHSPSLASLFVSRDTKSPPHPRPLAIHELEVGQGSETRGKTIQNGGFGVNFRVPYVGACRSVVLLDVHAQTHAILEERICKLGSEKCD